MHFQRQNAFQKALKSHCFPRKPLKNQGFTSKR